MCVIIIETNEEINNKQGRVAVIWRSGSTMDGIARSEIKWGA